MSDNATPLILLTRPRVQAERFADLCRKEFGGAAEIMISPLMRIDLQAFLPPLEDDAALVFTSENGVRAYSGMGGGAGRMAFCVGDRTAEAATQIGLDAFTAGGTVRDLIAMVIEAAPKGPLLHIHGQNVRGDVAGDLSNAGIDAKGLAAYAQEALPLSDAARAEIESPRRTVLPVFSPRTAEILAEHLPIPQNCRFACISDTTRDALPVTLQANAAVADEPNGKAVLNCLARQLCT